MDQASQGIMRVGSKDDVQNGGGKTPLKPHVEENMNPIDLGPNEVAMFEEFDSVNFTNYAKDTNSLALNHTYLAGNPKTQETSQKIPLANKSKPILPKSQNGGSHPSKEAHYFHTEEDDKKQQDLRSSHADDFVAFDTREKNFFQEDPVFCFPHDTNQNLDNLERTEEYKTYYPPKTIEPHVKQEHKTSIKCEHVTQPMAVEKIQEVPEANPKSPKSPQIQKKQFITSTNVVSSVTNNITNSIPSNVTNNIPSTVTSSIPSNVTSGITSNLPHYITSIPPQDPFQQISQPRFQYFQNSYGLFHSPISLLQRSLLMNYPHQFMTPHSQPQFVPNKLPVTQMELQSQAFRPDIMSLKQKLEMTISKPKEVAEDLKVPLASTLINNLSPITDDLTTPLKDCGLDLYALASKFTPEAPKKRPGKKPFELPKDVGRHFLKVHMKKVIAYVLNNTDKITEVMKNYLFKNNQQRWAFSETQKEEFLRQKTKSFVSWIEGLKKVFKDYGKEDFKTAYCIDVNVIRERINNAQRGERNSMKELFTYRDWDTQVTFKEVFRLITLEFIRNIDDNGLIYELMNANNILAGVEHIRYVFLSEWLIEKPSRIDGAEIFGKKWVENFFKTNDLLLPETKGEQ